MKLFLLPVSYIKENCVFSWFILLQPKQMSGFLLLLNQLICKFNILVRDILEEIFPSVADRIFSVIPREGLPSGPDAVTEV
jgi:exportin-T